jgi:hypothetical protein
VTHRGRFLLAFTVVHAALTTGVMASASAMARDRARLGREPSLGELFLVTAEGLLSTPVFSILGRFPHAARWAGGLYVLVPTILNSFLWACALGWLLGRRPGRVRSLLE